MENQTRSVTSRENLYVTAPRSPEKSTLNHEKLRQGNDLQRTCIRNFDRTGRRLNFSQLASTAAMPSWGNILIVVHDDRRSRPT